MHRFGPLGCLLGTLAALGASDWPQDLGNAQRTAWTPESPATPWSFAWTWNGPDECGGPGGHFYHQPRRHEPWEARVIVATGLVFVPAGTHGLFALRLTDGTVVWRFSGGECHAAAAFDAASGSVFVGTEAGTLHRLNTADGRELGRYDAGAPLRKALLLANGHLFALAADGVLHKVASDGVRGLWRYVANSPASTLPAYSATRDLVIFATKDLQVHAVAALDGQPRWQVKPTPLTPADEVEFCGGWPVIAEQTGVVFVRLGHANLDTVLGSGGGPRGQWPADRAAIRQRLRDRPELRNLFALRLEDGAVAFMPGVGPAGVEDLREGRPRLRVHAFPVVRLVDGREVAYLPWRHGDTRDPDWDGRWDSHLGEMMLDDSTLAGLVAGDLRFVQFAEHGGWLHITDEACPLTMAGDTIFHAHWDASTAARIRDRSPALGLTRPHPIRTEKLPPVVRHLRRSAELLDCQTRWAKGGLQLVDGRFLEGPGWWVYANVLDPPTPSREAYSEGILPRITFAASGHIIVQGNGGDLFILRHRGR